MRGVIACIAGCLLWTAASFVCADESDDSPATETRSKVDRVSLSADQLARLNALSDEFGPRISEAEQKAALTETQRLARTEAIVRAAREGQRGANARQLIEGALRPTEAQQAAFQEATRLHHEFDQAVFDLLTETQRSELEAPPPPANARSGFIIVRLARDVPPAPNVARTLEEAAARLNLPGLRDVIAELRLTQSHRAVDPQLLDQLATDHPRASPDLVRRLRAYWLIDVREKMEDIDAILKRLNELPEVDIAYAGLAATEPAFSAAVNPSDDPHNWRQEYLDAAPHGIDARAAWLLTGGDGAGVGAVDLERSWNVNHEELTLKSPLLLHGDIKPGSDHGTSVLGVLTADDNTVGIVGIAPAADYVFLTSWYHSSGADSDISNALVMALLVMNPGDVLLIEYELSGWPAEVEELNFDVIQLATFCDIIVVEAAGNGAHDLDGFTNSSSQQILNRSSPDFRDSGAVMVGASYPWDAHDRARFSTYGSRVDCFASGGRVTSSGYGDLDNGGGDSNRTYTKKFHGTSSAVPIVAGAAMIVQGLWKATFGTKLSPTDMRTILSDPLTGTPQGPTRHGNIGVMPDLSAIIRDEGLGEPPPHRSSTSSPPRVGHPCQTVRRRCCHPVVVRCR